MKELKDARRRMFGTGDHSNVLHPCAKQNLVGRRGFFRLPQNSGGDLSVFYLSVDDCSRAECVVDEVRLLKPPVEIAQRRGGLERLIRVDFKVLTVPGKIQVMESIDFGTGLPRPLKLL